MRDPFYIHVELGRHENTPYKKTGALTTFLRHKTKNLENALNFVLNIYARTLAQYVLRRPSCPEAADPPPLYLKE